VRAACAAAIKAHENIEYKWLTVVGWDCMIMEEEMVFFEGNFAGARVPRRMFLNLATLYYFVVDYFWPFGTGNSARPGIQAYGGGGGRKARRRFGCPGPCLR